MPSTITTASLADLLEALVRIPSETGDERAIADWVAARLGECDAGERLRSGSSVVWRGPSRGRPLVVLAGHLDTVPANPAVTTRIEAGRLHGRGASDMKAGDAVMLSLVETLDPDRLGFDVAAVFYEAEEGPADGNGLARLLREMPWLG